jgi:glucosylceramidase
MMGRLLSSTTGISLAILLAACGSGNNGGISANGGATESGGGSTGNGGTAGNDSGGTAGTASGGTAGSPNGGAGGNSSGGSAGSQSGGAGGGAGGKSSGGSAGNPNGGAAGNPNGGSSTNPSGGTSNPAGGAGGKDTSAGGSAGSGGVQGSGGATSPGSGGSAAPSTALVTSASGAYWKTGTWTESTGSATVTVNDTSTAQTWEGFGGAFNEKGWSYLSTKALQDQAMQLLFGVDGAHFAWGRIPIGASDYGMDRYTLDETANDTSMSGFSIDRDKQKLIPYIKAAQAVKPDLRFWASPWTPPTWMKSSPYQTPGNPVNAFDGGTMKSDEAILKAHAQYFVKFVQAYGEQGIKIEYVAPQNEPNYSQNYPSCLWSASTFTTFIGKHLGPALAAANSTAQVMLGTMSNNGSNADVAVANAVLADATAKGYCKVMGVQWGMSDANQVSNLKSKGAGIPIWLSETKCGGPMGQDVAAAPNDLAYAKDSWGYIRDAIKNGLSAYNAWNMVLDKGGRGIDNTRIWAQNALLVVDGGQITQTPAYYVYRHFSQFADPGAKVVGTSGGDAIAFKNPDGSLVVVMYNSGSAGNAVVAIGGKKLQFAIPGSGWATVKYKP